LCEYETKELSKLNSQKYVLVFNNIARSRYR